jgi:hypothetical protein
VSLVQRPSGFALQPLLLRTLWRKLQTPSRKSHEVSSTTLSGFGLSLRIPAAEAHGAARNAISRRRMVVRR